MFVRWRRSHGEQLFESDFGSERDIGFAVDGALVVAGRIIADAGAYADADRGGFCFSGEFSIERCNSNTVPFGNLVGWVELDMHHEHIATGYHAIYVDRLC